jgi:flagellar hook protein FlgE
MMISGDGFFVIEKNGAKMFTRAGNFTVDAVGHLVTPDGAVAMEVDPTTTPPTITGPINLSQLLDPANKFVSWSIDATGTINGVKDDGTITQLGVVGLATFANPNGLMKAGNSAYVNSANSGDPDYGMGNDGGRGAITSGYVEMSNVDLAAELTNLIISERGFQANSKVITTSDEVLQTLVNLK